MGKHTVSKVNHPTYYNNKYECIDIMIDTYGIEQTMSFCLLNAFKYLYRCNEKHSTPIEDLKKAQWYISKYIELYGQQKCTNDASTRDNITINN